MSKSSFQNFKCTIVGDAYTGKTTLVRSLMNHSTLEKYKTGRSHYVYPVIFTTNVGTITFDIYDTDHQTLYGSVRDSFYKNSDCAIILYDVTSRLTYENILFWYRKIKAANQATIIALCGNKVEMRKIRCISEDMAKSEWGNRVKYFEVSSKAKIGLYEPFLYLTEKLLMKGKIEEFSIIGSEVSVSLKSLHEMLEEEKSRKSAEENDISV